MSYTSGSGRNLHILGPDGDAQPGRHICEIDGKLMISVPADQAGVIDSGPSTKRFSAAQVGPTPKRMKKPIPPPVDEEEEDEEDEIFDPDDEPEAPNSLELVLELEDRFMNNRKKLIAPDGYIRTPLHVLKQLAMQFKMPLRFQYHKVLFGLKPIYYVELVVGVLIGKGECTRRRLAAQMASVDVLKQIKTANLPMYGLVPGCRIHPKVFGELIYVCELLGVKSPRYTRMPIDPEEVDPWRFTFKCQIGQLIQLGYSDNLVCAKRWAAKKMFEALTGDEVKMDRVCSGDKCNLLERYNGNNVYFNEMKKQANTDVEMREQESQMTISKVSGDIEDMGDSDEEEEQKEEFDRIAFQVDVDGIRRRIKYLDI